MRRCSVAAILLAASGCKAQGPGTDASPPEDALSVDAGVEASRADSLCRDDAGTWHLPNPAWTPGKVCTPNDPTFKEWRYGGRVAVCVRYVTMGEKDEIAKAYGLPKDAYKTVEFDHYIPLSAGGSDDKTNLWPQPLGEAKEKDKIEVEVYNALSAGEIDQDEAIARIRAWRPATCPK
jgi:hypothetical protein